MQEAAKGDFFKISLLKLVLAGSQGGSPGVHKGQRAPGDENYPTRLERILL